MPNNTVKHLGVIMDGNRRWAKKHMLSSVLEGHSRGAYRLLDLCEWCEDLGIEHLSAYAFSTENWSRSREEVDGLFRLMDKFFAEEIDKCIRNGVRIRIIGNRELLSEQSMNTINKVESMTADCKKLNLYIALSYGGRDEIVRSVRECCNRVRAGNLLVRDIDEELFGSMLDSYPAPDIDMVIRTGGQKRMSNFMPWQTVYSEMYFMDVLWPDFSRKMLEKALRYYETIQINKGK